MALLWRDALLALRSWSRRPIYAVVFVSSLALGIGAATAVFTLVDSILFRPLPLPNPQQLVTISADYRNQSRIPISYPMFSELERTQRVFSGLCGWTVGRDSNVEIDGKMSLFDVRSVTTNYYAVLGVRPWLGRMIAPSDQAGSEAAQVAVISYALWKKQFGGDPAIIGKSMRIEGKLFTIIGVTDKWFTGTTVGSEPQITIPAGSAQFYDVQSRSLLWLFVTGRLEPGRTMANAGSDLQSFWPRLLEDTVPTESKGARRQSFLSMGLEIDPAGSAAHRAIRSRILQPLNLLLGVVILILVVVCINLSCLVLARASARKQEIRTRIALGATPWQAVRMFLLETSVFSVTGALVGLLLAYVGSPLLLSLMSRNQKAPLQLDVRPDGPILCFAAAAAILTGVCIGLIPALHLARRSSGADSLKQTSIARHTGRLGRILIISQIAISLALLQSAGLLVRTLQNLNALDPGFEKAGVTEFQLEPGAELLRACGSGQLPEPAHRCRIEFAGGAQCGILQSTGSERR